MNQPPILPMRNKTPATYRKCVAENSGQASRKMTWQSGADTQSESRPTHTWAESTTSFPVNTRLEKAAKATDQVREASETSAHDACSLRARY